MLIFLILLIYRKSNKIAADSPSAEPVNKMREKAKQENVHGRAGDAKNKQAKSTLANPSHLELERMPFRQDFALDNRSFGSILIYSICRISILLNTFFANSLVRNQFITLHKLMLTLFSIFFLTLFFDASIKNRCDNREYDDNILSWISFVGSFNRILNSSFSSML